MKSLLIALQFLTRIPVPVKDCTPEQIRASVYWYGVAGPVIGLMQGGGQAFADRYTYLPQIGLMVAVSWAGFHSSQFGGNRPSW